jgi:hypothetical protein
LEFIAAALGLSAFRRSGFIPTSAVIGRARAVNDGGALPALKKAAVGWLALYTLTCAGACPVNPLFFAGLWRALRRWVEAGFMHSGFVYLHCPVRLAGGASLSFASPKESKQRKGDAVKPS